MAKKEVLNDNIAQCLVDTQKHLTTALDEISQLKDQIKEVNEQKSNSDQVTSDEIQKNDGYKYELFLVKEELAKKNDEKEIQGREIERLNKHIDFVIANPSESGDSVNLQILDNSSSNSSNSTSEGDNNHTTSPETDSITM